MNYSLKQLYHVCYLLGLLAQTSKTNHRQTWLEWYWHWYRQVSMKYYGTDTGKAVDNNHYLAA